MDPKMLHFNTNNFAFRVTYWKNKNRTKDIITKKYLKTKRKIVKKRKLLKKAFCILTSQLLDSNDQKNSSQDEMRINMENFLSVMMKDSEHQHCGQIYNPTILDENKVQSGNQKSNPIILDDNQAQSGDKIENPIVIH